MPVKLKLNHNGKRPNEDSDHEDTKTPPKKKANKATTKPKLTLKLGGNSKASTPVEPSQPALEEQTSPQSVKKEPRARKPSAKAAAASVNGKGAHEDSDNEDESAPAVNPPANPQVKKFAKISLRTASATPVKLKFKGKPPVKPTGEGYDSEASDREEDPTVEENFTLRFDEKLIFANSGVDCSDDCAYIHQMIREKKIGTPAADIRMRFYSNEGRRAAVTVRRNVYAATLVDLPTVTESMKSFDKRNWMKTADVWQMLLVFAKIKEDKEANVIDLPKVVDEKTYEFPHGLTPPMRFARHRRFRHRARRNDIEEVEKEVERLLAEDLKFYKNTPEWYDPEAEAQSRNASHALEEDDVEEPVYDYEDDNMDADGEVDDQVYYQEDNMDDVQDELERAMMDNMFEEAATPATAAATPMAEIGASTPAAEGQNEAEAESEEDSGDEDDDEEEEEEEVEELSDEQKAKQALIAEQRVDIHDLEIQIEEIQQKLIEHGDNVVFRGRLQRSLDNTRQELMLKKAAIGDVDDD